MSQVKFTPIARRFSLGPDKHKMLGTGINLSLCYTNVQLQTKLSFVGKISNLLGFLPIAPKLKGLDIEKLPLATAEITLSGKVQGVVMRGTVQSIIKQLVSAENRGLVGEVSNNPDKTVSFKVSANPIELLLIMEYFQAGRGYQVVVGTENGLENNQWIITEGSEEVPEKAHSVYFPRIDAVEYKIIFEGEDLPETLSKELSFEAFLQSGWAEIINKYYDGDNANEAYHFLPQVINKFLKGDN
jgi:acylphosphatase